MPALIKEGPFCNVAACMTASRLMKSRFVHRFEREPQTYCLYHSLTQQKVYGGEILDALWRAFDQPCIASDAIASSSRYYDKQALAGIVDDLYNKGMLVEDNKRDIEQYTHLLQRGIESYRIGNTYFMPAGDCNLRCKYCFVENPLRDDHAGSLMEVETARKALEVYAKLTRDAEQINLTFYGGEPLLNKEVVYFSMKYIRELESIGRFKRPVVITLLTNGTLVDEKTVEAVRETSTHVAISLDGPGALHDKARKQIGGRGSFQNAKRAFDLFKASGITPGMSCTLHKYNIDHIDEIVDFIAELSPAGVGFNPLLPTEAGGNPADADFAFVTKQMLKAFLRLRELGIYEDRIMRRVKPFSEEQFHIKDCMGVGGQIVITPEGNIGPCQALYGVSKYFPYDVNELYSNIDIINSKTIYSDPLFSEWRHRFPLNMAACSDCFAIAVCGGGCPYAAQVTRGSIWEIDERVCTQARNSLEWMIWDTYKSMQEDVGEPA